MKLKTKNIKDNRHPLVIFTFLKKEKLMIFWFPFKIFYKKWQRQKQKRKKQQEENLRNHLINKLPIVLQKKLKKNK